MVAALSKEIKQEFGYLGLFLIISAWGLVALLATALYPQNPSPKSNKLKLTKNGAITMNHGESKSFFKQRKKLKPQYSEQVYQTLFVHYIKLFTISNVIYLVNTQNGS